MNITFVREEEQLFAPFTYHAAGFTSLCRKTFLSMAEVVFLSLFLKEDDTGAGGLLPPFIRQPGSRELPFGNENYSNTPQGG